MKIIFSFFIFFLLISCVEKKPKYKVFNSALREVVEMSPLSEKELLQEEEESLPSYYVCFYKINNDTLLAITKQPYLFEDFPLWLFDKDNVDEKGVISLTGKPAEEKIDLQGLFYLDGKIPVTVFDNSNKFYGKGFYDKDTLIKKVPKKYLFNIVHSKEVLLPRLYLINKDKLSLKDCVGNCTD